MSAGTDGPAADGNVARLHTPRRCPQCGRASDRTGPAYPFCSVRCSELDLAKWFDGTYTVPVVEADSSSPAERDQVGDHAPASPPRSEPDE